MTLRPDGQAPDHAADGSGPRARRLVLYIEDDQTNVRLMEHILKRDDVELLSAPRGGLGIELARRHRPDLVLLDLTLPDMNGEDVAIALQADAATRAIPIVVLTGAADDSQLQRLFGHGVSDYVPKPFDIAQLEAVVERHARRRSAPAR